MAVRKRTAPPAGPEAPPSPPPRPLRTHLPGLLVPVLVGAGLLAFYLRIYHRYSQPAGYDTPRYLFQTTLAADLGLAHVPRTLPPPSRSLADRVGFPVMVLEVSRLFGVSRSTAAAVVPAAGAVALALAAAALASRALQLSPGATAAVAAVTGTSPVLIRLLAPETYTDALLGGAALVAALVPATVWVREGRGFLAATLLLAAGALVHPSLFALIAGVLGILALAHLPASWRSLREGRAGLLATPSARLAAVVAGAAALAGAGFLALLRQSPLAPRQTRVELAKKLRLDLPLYRFPLTAPLASVGAALLAAPAPWRWLAPLFRPPPTSSIRWESRFLLWLALAWGALTAGAVAAFSLGQGVAAHRFLAFLVPLPVLGTLGLLALGAAVARWWRPAGVAAVVVAVVALGFLGYRDLYVQIPRDRGIEFLDRAKARDALTARLYLRRAGIPASRPVVFVVDDRGPNPISFVPEMAYMIRSALSSEQIRHTYFYVGDPEAYLAGRPTYRDRPAQYNPNVRRFWPAVARLLPRRPVALMPAAYNPAFGAFAARHPGTLVAPNLAVLSGPRVPVAVADPHDLHPRRLLVVGAAVGALLGLVGLAWGVALLPVGLRPLEVLALAPAIGVAATVVVGVLVDAAGFRLGGPGGAVAPVVAATVGAALALGRLRRARGGGAPQPAR